jgi:hypothetical protein
VFVGLGQRLVATDTTEFGLMDLRTVVLAEAPASAATAPTDAD